MYNRRPYYGQSFCELCKETKNKKHYFSECLQSKLFSADVFLPQKQTFSLHH